MMTRVDRDQYGHVDDAGRLPGQAPSRPAHPELRPAPGWLPDEVRIYATGDIHGRADLLGLMLAAIDRDLAEHPCRLSREVYLGDLIDRGPHSAAVIDMLIARRRTRLCDVLAGNHEAMLMAAMSDPGTLQAWLGMGGLQTLGSYGVAPPPPEASASARANGIALVRRAIPAAHLAFLASLELSCSLFGYLFVHAGIRPGIPLSAQAAADLLWIRAPFLNSTLDHGQVVVHGHTSIPEPEILPNRINVDTGAWLTGRLTCVVLEGRSMRFIRVAQAGAASGP